MSHGSITYEGGFKDGKFHGVGVLRHAVEKVEYEGQFNNGRVEGRGVEVRDGDDRGGRT